MAQRAYRQRMRAEKADDEEADEAEEAVAAAAAAAAEEEEGGEEEKEEEKEEDEDEEEKGKEDYHPLDEDAAKRAMAVQKYVSHFTSLPPTLPPSLSSESNCHPPLPPSLPPSLPRQHRLALRKRRVRRRCFRQMAELSAWWREALEGYANKRRWMQLAPPPGGVGRLPSR